ncbi:phosphoribosyl 1,2-cyclic phosphate phosphodiesterase [Anaerosolibacter carboniphilus]|uniref:Phosphoribosyl 1,2-cyclic phosphate phosphodiesterase n=1 Tax=Anaerosolibacter carboniphilus TaxID=1417629 RepID=A0A841KQ51_9FIRM|nr:MBL fold metallo-hydrolase [Anaerosolibacter carboniphilus]MBB6215884.1 phosphoribosyl 1,2-cyclic phosphate phosphodiesterase [Anaerosolibacter carboniphilus]
MKIKVLGSGASEGFPAIFCNCDSCIKARKAGGKNIRTRSQFYVDEDMMIDFGDDTYYHSLNENISLSKLKYLLITHSHIDHYNPTIFRYRGGYYATELYESVLKVYSTPTVKEIYENMDRGKPMDEVKSKIEFNVPAEFVPFSIGDYTIHALQAIHMKNEKCYMYLVEKDGKRVLFGNDSGYYPDETFEYLKGMHLDLVFLDCTFGLHSYGINSSHMGIPENLKVKERFYENGTADDSTVFVTHHFTHTCGSTHEELCEETEKHGLLVSHDGMLFEL